MKFSYPISMPDHQINVLAFSGELERNFCTISEIGYSAVELLVRYPGNVQIDTIEEMLEKYSLEISAIGTSPMQIQDKLFLIHPERHVREEAMRRFNDLVKLAAHFKVPALLGKYRGNISEELYCTKEDLYKMFYLVCSYANKYDVNILMEPQNKNSINNLNTVKESLEWIDKLKCKNLGLLLDTYHMGYTEDSIVESIKEAQNKIGFIHMADTDRQVPGFGGLPIKEVLNTLIEINYQGYVSLEIKQEPDSASVAKLSLDSLNNILKN